jgi:hypothetical protein
MLLDWLLCAVGLFLTAVVSGVAVGLVAKGRSWRPKRIVWVANFSFLAVWVMEYLLHLRFPWPVRDLAQRGFPLASVVGVALVSLCFSLADTIAKRVSSVAEAST